MRRPRGPIPTDPHVVCGNCQRPMADLGETPAGHLYESACGSRVLLMDEAQADRHARLTQTEPPPALLPPRPLALSLDALLRGETMQYLERSPQL